MSSPVYQNMVNLIVSFLIWRHPIIFINFGMLVHHTFDFGVSVLASVEALTFIQLIWHPISNKHNPLNCWYDSPMHKKICTLFMILVPLYRKVCILLQVWCYHPPMWISFIATKSNLCFDSSLELSLGSQAYTNSLHSIIRISYPYSVTWIIYPKNLSRSDALFCFCFFCNKFIFNDVVGVRCDEEES
jgi:hypothetical protein